MTDRKGEDDGLLAVLHCYVPAGARCDAVLWMAFLNRPPKKINALYGYRTSRSMKNQQTWDYAHQVCGKLWFRAGIVMLPLSLLAMLPALGKDTQALGIWLMGVVLVQVVVMIATIFPVEKALKRKFDKFGRRIG